MAEKPKFYVILTAAGAELEARAVAAGKGIELFQIAVGDANQEYMEPQADVTALINEQYRCAIETREQSPDDPAVTLLWGRIPPEDGGFWIREIGVYGRLDGEEDGEEEEVLFAYGNHAPYFKMKPQEGQSVSHEICIPVIQSSSCPLTVVVRDDGYATKAEVEELRRQIGTGNEAAFVELADNMVRMSSRIAAIELGASQFMNQIYRLKMVSDNARRMK